MIPCQHNTAEPTGNLGEAMKVKKTKATAKPRRIAAKKEKAAEVAKTPKPSRGEIEQLARTFWAERGYQDGYAEQDWLRAERELLERTKIRNGK
jgi:hypothetical protein